METARRVTAKVFYNSEEITQFVEGYVRELEYTDPSTGESDKLTLTLRASVNDWLNPWCPDNGSEIEAQITVHDWRENGDARTLFFGKMCLDEYGFSGTPTTIKLSALSVPSDTEWRETKRTQTWEEATVEEVAATMADRAGVELMYDADEVGLAKAEQNDRTDCDFLYEVCSGCGLSIKFYNGKLVIYDTGKYEQQQAAHKFTFSDFISWNYRTSLLGAYTGGVMTYTDGITDDEYQAETGKAGRMLNVTGSADSIGKAEFLIKEAVREANREITEFTCTMLGNPDIAASTCVALYGMGKMDGKYFIKKATHTVSSGYVTRLEMYKIEQTGV